MLTILTTLGETSAMMSSEFLYNKWFTFTATILNNSIKLYSDGILSVSINYNG